MQSIVKASVFSLAVLFIAAGCSQRTVTRVSPDQQIDLSGRWNDTDSKLVAEEMIRDVLNRPWREDFSRAKNAKPVVIVGLVTNKSHEHIESETFIKDIEREFINSGMVRVVQNSVFREKMREERADQQEFASPETQKKWGAELGADFMLFGTINSIVDSYSKEKVVLYKVDLELANLQTNEKVWIGDKEIKKFIRN
ncbi:penicillin-binding protein activator LpoB [uncultured Imperialibacter sp.]|uniref:penicillin-binding protein activator LpoB n=1 Tax=uncultured Imperialibacter sp. TaxID=1672639 RepID=UPI0030DA9F4E|tara:strand:- start:15498 stop:16088 length:591 start_codon:yes stop_codon:yes gene_type:complete